MNKTLIELKAINALERELNKTNRIVPDIKSNDKTPSWDGELRFYKKNSENFSKEDLINRVPVQVKGTYCDTFSNGNICYQVDVSDLSNYQKDNGVIFFVIQIKSDDEYRIFYKSLLPFDLREIIDGLPEGQKTKSIKLTRFPQRHFDGISKIIYSFILDRSNQGKLLPELTSLSDAKNIEIEEYKLIIPAENVNSEEEAIDYLLSNPVYVYAKPKGISESFAADIINASKISQKITAPVIVNGETLFDNYEIIRTKKKKPILKIGNTIFIKIDKKNIEASISEKGTLSDLIKSNKFYIAVADNNEVFIGKSKFEIPNVQINEKDVVQVKENLAILISIKQALDKLNVNKDLDLSKVDCSEITKLAHIAKSINEKCAVPLYSEYDSVANVFSIGNISILIKVVSAEKEHNSYIYDFFKNRNVSYLLDDGQECYVSPYVVLDKEAITNYDNFNCSDIIESIKSFKLSETYAGKINEFALTLLQLYDESYFQTNYILKIVLELFEYLQSYDEKSDIYQINRIQTKHRLGIIDKSDKKYLIKLKNSKISTDFKVAANILLGSFIEASFEYEKLSKEEKERFDNYPIKNLYNE